MNLLDHVTMTESLQAFFCDIFSVGSLFSFFSPLEFFSSVMAAESEGGNAYVDPLPLPAHHPTSRVLQNMDEGGWTFSQEAFLIPHEALRVATERVSRALTFYNPQKCPWKVDRVATYLLEYYIPAVHEHHDNEEHIFVPFYTKLGVEGGCLGQLVD